MANRIRVAVWVAAVLLVPACKSDPTVAPAKGDFVLSDPVNGAIGVSTTPTFDWEESFSVETPTYTIQVSTDPGFSSFLINQSGLATTSFTPATALTAGTPYYWQVLAIRSTGTVVATGAPWTFTTFSPTPGPFTMIAPTNASTGVSLTPTFSWNTSLGAASYTLQVATDIGFTSIVVNQTGITATGFTLTTALTASTPYFWQVLAVSTTSVTATGAPWSFTTGSSTVTNTVTLVSPANASTGVSTTPTFSWTSTGSPATYTLQVSTDPAFGSFAINQSGNTSTSVTVTTALAAQTLYYWRVESLDGSSNVLATSSSFTLTTGN
jgi:hypothetical protein